MVVKTSIGFLAKRKDMELSGDVDVIVDAMGKAPAFKTPVPPLADVNTANAAYKVAIANSINGGKEARAILMAKRAEVVSLMRQLAAYVTATSNGNMATLLSSAFPIQKPTRTPIGVLPAPEGPKVKQGPLTGELLASTKPVAGASSYNWRIATSAAPNVAVQQAQTTGGRNSFKGLTPGQTYTVQVNAVGAAGVSNWSDDGEMMVI